MGVAPDYSIFFVLEEGKLGHESSTKENLTVNTLKDKSLPFPNLSKGADKYISNDRVLWVMRLL